ncbi:hypothetical protein DV711_06175 [Motiliproteus coralliicola]|uniref:Terminase large subunit gp17-like C-terminal domain-containing protein n=1 Tax=Motiliproteus coralliicola TaxID=2283196 RepID=A0A369WVS1_9GAMM|nr:phage terminase large subunit [Motiliproteus coralliicola]RDE25139.1 hypothetical protein DV711_06175 [Motiliproteus coralliicola]
MSDSNQEQKKVDTPVEATKVKRRREVLQKRCGSCKSDRPAAFFVGDTCIYCVQDAQEAAEAAQREEDAAKKAREAARKAELQRADLRKQKELEVLRRKQEQEERRRQAKIEKQEEERRKAEFDAKMEARRELAKREASRRFLLPFVERFSPDYMAGWVHKDICRRLEKFSDDVAAKKSPRLMLFMPPRHGKSELASKTFPAWHLGRHPHHEVIASSYSGALAMDFSRKVRELLRDAAYRTVFRDSALDKNSQSAERWNTTAGGGYVAAGVGGPITGRGAHVLIIDDPIKNAEDADSEAARESLWNWYTSTAYTRLAPGGGVLIILTRWHDDDLAGRLLKKQEEGGEPWEVIRYPALATEQELYRSQNQALHPERYDEAALNRIRDAVGSRVWSALYQQNPVPDEGDYFTKDMIYRYDINDLPAISDMRFYTAWDLAIGKNESNDYSVGITVGIDRQRKLWVVDIRRGRWNSKEIVDQILDCWDVWRSEKTGIEKGHIEMAIGPYLEEEIVRRGYTAFFYEGLPPGRRDKALRARPIQGMMQRGMVLFRQRCDRAQELINELLRFPNGTHDDQVDALAWIGQMIQDMGVVRLAPPPKAKSWKDKLGAFVGGSKSERDPMSA